MKLLNEKFKAKCNYYLKYQVIRVISQRKGMLIVLNNLKGILMSKFFITMLLIITSLTSFASKGSVIEPVNSDGEVFGISSGVYQGSGVLYAEKFYIPDLSYTSIRTLKNGIIIAKTKATILGIKVGGAQARLKVMPIVDGKFELLDIDNSLEKVGSGECFQDQCRFDATVMDGELRLKETWQVDRESFEIIKGFQNMKGAESTYDGLFTKTN